MSTIFAQLANDAANIAAPAPSITGQVIRFDGQLVECAGFPASPGARCEIHTRDGSRYRGEVIGFNNRRNTIFLDQPFSPIQIGDKVSLLPGGKNIPVGDALLGRVTDADGLPLDIEDAPIRTTETWPLLGKLMNPLKRTPVAEPLDVGVRMINSALTVGRGQRIGIVAGSGVGKSVLMEMMARYTEADVVVVGLIGERAREVGAFARALMTDDAARKICMVAVPADRSPLLRLRGARRATAIAEHFRSQGKQVLLMIDSLTRVAHAQREIGLALGEPPTSKGYPPSVIAMIPSLIERAGPGLPGEGAITAIYTVLADGDDTTNDPVVDTARAILDGHIVLSRRQTQMGLYPAIDLPQSVSRVMNDIVDPAHLASAQRLRKLISLYMDNRDLMLMGGYVKGQDADLDAAVELWPHIENFIRQSPHAPAPFAEARQALISLMESNR
ncbi:MAG: FliI/YscN family ATPase [Marivivens sp.]|nr:FliI/YscN family ATPase [Marivivens sp.]